MWGDITLITKVPGANANGIPTDQEHPAQVLGSKKSVKRTEYYKALKAGDQPSIAVEVWAADFLDASVTDKDGNIYEPSELIYNNQRFKIGRTYNGDGEDKMELTCSKIM